MNTNPPAQLEKGKTKTINESGKKEIIESTTNLPSQTTTIQIRKLVYSVMKGRFYLIVRKRNDALYCI